MVRQRYETMDGGRQDDYARYQQQYRKPASTGGAVQRYEVGRRSLQSLQSSAKAKQMKIFKNGAQGKSDPPAIIIFKSKLYPGFDILLNDISNKKKTLVNYLFKWPSGEMVHDLCDIDDDIKTEIYVCSDKRKLLTGISYGGISYGSNNGNVSALTEKSSRNSYGSRGMKQSPTARNSNASMNVISNKTGQQINLFKDPNSRQSFEEFLRNIQEMLDHSHPIHTLYIIGKPLKQINSISSLNRALQQHEDTFLACGRNEEPDPKYLRSRESSPMRNGNHQRQRNGNKQDIYHDDRSRQSNGHMTYQDRHVDSHGRSYQRHQDDEEYEDDTEQEEYEQEPSSPPPRRGGRYQDKSPKRDSRQPPYRQNNRREEEDRSPRRDNRQAPDRRSQRKDDDDEEEDTSRRGNRRENERQKPKRQQTPPRKEDSKRRNTRDDTDNDDDNDDDDDDRERYHPSEEEMEERIKAMETIDPDLDKKILY